MLYSASIFVGNLPGVVPLNTLFLAIGPVVFRHVVVGEAY